MDQTIPGFPRITVNPNKMGGRPCIRGQRITVQRALELLGQQLSPEEFKEDYPGLEPEDLQEALRFAAAMLDERFILFPGPAA